MRTDTERLGDGLLGAFRGADDLDARAASMHFAHALQLIEKALGK